ncbi:hypothetical protein AALA22_13085 [Anaerovoracaceae bacterium 41-7]
MFNEEHKTIYLNTIQSDNKRKDFQRIFNVFEPIEEEKNMDICDMNPREYLEVIPKICINPKFYRFSIIMSLILEYRSWCEIKGIMKDPFKWKRERITANDIYAIYRKVYDDSSVMLIDQEVLYRKLTNQLYPDYNSDYSKSLLISNIISMSNLTAIYVILVSCGIKPDDVINMKKNQVSIENSEISYRDIKIKIPDILKSDLNELLQCDRVLVTRNNIVPLNEGFLVAFDSAEKVKNKFYGKLTRSKRKMDLEISLSKLFDVGVVRNIAVLNDFVNLSKKEIDEEYKKILGIDYVLNGSKVTELFHWYNEIVEYFN